MIVNSSTVQTMACQGDRLEDNAFSESHRAVRRCDRNSASRQHAVLAATFPDRLKPTKEGLRNSDWWWYCSGLSNRLTTSYRPTAETHRLAPSDEHQRVEWHPSAILLLCISPTNRRRSRRQCRERLNEILVGSDM